MRVLGVETSCDETGIAIYDSQYGLIGHTLHSQVALHQVHGGVVPELASRDHIRRIVPLIQDLLVQASSPLAELDGIAYTAGPGLIGALLVGASVARSLAMGLNIPAVAVHHMEGHLLAPMLEDDVPEFPFIALLVSGGHTQLMRVDGLGKYHILGESLDDAAGEAFDKTAKLLELAYPGGPALAELAKQGRDGIYQFPRPMTDRPGLDFSFSGLKTFALNTFRKSDGNLHSDAAKLQNRADIAYAFQQAVVSTLAIKCKRALQQTGLLRLVVAGGVSANQALREKLRALAASLNAQVYYPRHEFCTDNGAMIAYAGCQRLLAGESDGLEINARARWPLNQA